MCHSGPTWGIKDEERMGKLLYNCFKILGKGWENFFKKWQPPHFYMKPLFQVYLPFLAINFVPPFPPSSDSIFGRSYPPPFPLIWGRGGGVPTMNLPLLVTFWPFENLNPPSLRGEDTMIKQYWNHVIYQKLTYSSKTVIESWEGIWRDSSPLFRKIPAF